MPSFHSLVILVSVLMLVCVFVSKFLTRAGVPILILFIGAGMLMGTDGVFKIDFDYPALTHEIGNIALCFILFHGGMELNWKTARPVLGRGLLLSTAGVALTAALTGLAAVLLAGMSFPNGLLLGAVLSSTDAASLFAIFKSQKLRLRGSIGPLLELESGTNDPVAYLLVLALLDFAQHPAAGLGAYALLLAREIGFGVLIGAGLGFGMVFLLNHVRFNIESMYFVVGLALMMLTYSVCAFIEGNCFLAVFLAGAILGNSSFLRKLRFIGFFEGQSWLAQILLFLTLGLQVFPSRLGPVALEGLGIAAALILIIRPLAVAALLAPLRVPLREQLFIAGAGFRGAASIVFATYPIVAGLPAAQDIFNIVFVIAVVSILLQGTLLGPLARRLRVAKPQENAAALREFRQYADELSDLPVLGAFVPPGSKAAGKSVRELGMPEGVRILAMRQQERYAPVEGRTVLRAGDRLLLTTRSEEDLVRICEQWELET